MTVTLNGQITADEIAASLPDSKRNGKGWLVRCPCHTDDKPSLSVSDTDKGVIVHCFAGCDWQDVKKALGIYRNGNGWDKNAFVVAVYDHPDGRPRPRYREDHDGECWRKDCTKIGKHKHIWGEKGRSSTGCYLLTWGEDSPEKTLVLVEGEKAAKALLAHVDGKGYTPVTWNGGAGVSKSIFDVVDGRDVILWPDADGPGKRAMKNAAVSATEAGCSSLRLVDVADLPDKADAADVDAETALRLLDSAELFEAPENTHGGAREGAGRPPRDASFWTIVNDRGFPLRSSVSNMLSVLEAFGDTEFKYDEFADMELADGVEVDDAYAIGLQKRSEDAFSFSPTRDALFGAITLICRRDSFHPVRDYLAGLKWDGKRRLARAGSTYFGAEDSPLQNAIGRLIIDGMVNRIMQPGCKFDYLPVLQSERQGTSKSTALEILGGAWHAEGLPLDSFDFEKVLIERTRGVWILEAADLGGMRGSDIEKLKGAITAKKDSARMAYGRKRVTRQRQFVLAGTVNPTAFLKDVQNRRFPVLEVQRQIDLDALRRDRDQLFAEALQDVPLFGGHVTLPRALWDDAETHSQKFRVVSKFEEWFFDWVDGNLLRGQSFSVADLRDDMREAGLDDTNNQEYSRVLTAAGYRKKRRRTKDNKTATYWTRDATRRDATRLS